ncbi:efflux RND transporter periplasmic adaptor subunit [Pleionea sp. CnH1-48]|uniref:efflux RND transporter periplasmic adaptor subunit n=1 Tax=Pleionea sp. CnH1-48 TaxID=2954494 RepID=UPI00209724D8|nr:efflux RND transporter periplasmic adaptor subunit [Pleionea sp. CnH1-48]MCO7225668.1 efflux RND transporter periplasmic adaptor subunit [Pleionea sp. CnH1-48]
MKTSHSIFAGIAVIAVTAVGVMFMMKSKPEAPKKPTVDRTPLVEVMELAPDTVQFNVESQGVVMPRTETTLVSEVSGVVQNVSPKFVVGGYFKKGEVLLEIDPTDYQVALKQAKARLAGQQAQYAQEKARAEQALKEWDLSGRKRSQAPALALRKPYLAEAEANVLSAEADLQNAQRKLERTTIRAPYDGMLKNKLSDIGQFVGTGTQLGVIFAIDYAEVRLPLTDQELAYINVPDMKMLNEEGHSIPVTLQANYAGEDMTWNADIVRMEGVIDSNSRVHYAVAQINDPYRLFSTQGNTAPLKVGTFVTANINGVELDNLYKIPRDAFRDLDKVLVSDKDSRLYIRELKVVRAEANYVFVDSGLSEGDRVVLTSMESPVQGMKVRSEGDVSEVETEEAVAKAAPSTPVQLNK